MIRKPYLEKGRGPDKKQRKRRGVGSGYLEESAREAKSKGKVPASKYEMKVLHFQYNKGLTPGLAKRAAMKWFMDRGYDTPPHWNEEFGKADVATATMPRGHEAYTRTVEGKQQQIRQKGAVVKKPQPLEKPESATVVGADHKQFTQLLDSYFHNQEEMKMMMNLIDTHKTEMEAAMSELRPLLGKFANLEKAEQKFKTEFKEGDWNYKFLSYTKETKPYKDLYTKAFTMLDEIQRQEMKKAETALSKITGQEKFEREPVTKSQEYKDLVKSYIGKPLTEEALSKFRRDVLSLILLKAAKKATGEDEEYEKDKEETGKKPLPKDKDKGAKKETKKEQKAKDLPEEDDEGLGEAHQQLIEALQNLIAAKETGVHLLGEFFSRKKEEPKEAEPKKEKADKPKKEKDEKDEDSNSRKAEKKDKKKEKKEKDEEERKSLVDLVSPIVFKRYNDELQKALEQEKQDAFLEAFEKWEKACSGAKPVFRFGKPKKGKQAKKDQKKREKEDLEKARPHKYIKRLGVSGQYDYVYSDPARYHQTKIARDTLKMPDAMVGVMGGSKAEARKFLGLAADGSEDHRVGAAKKTFVVKEKAGQYEIRSKGSGPDVEGWVVQEKKDGKWHDVKEFGADEEHLAEKFQEGLEAEVRSPWTNLDSIQSVKDLHAVELSEFIRKKEEKYGMQPTKMQGWSRQQMEDYFEGIGVKEEPGAYGKKLPSDEEIAKFVSDVFSKESDPISATNKILGGFIKKWKLTIDNIGELMPKIKLAAKIYEQNMPKPVEPKVDTMKSDQLKAVGFDILVQTKSIKTPRGFGGFGLAVLPNLTGEGKYPFGEISITYDTPREIRHEDEYFDSRRNRSKAQQKAFGEWNHLDEQVFGLIEKMKAKYPGIRIEASGGMWGKGIIQVKQAGSSSYVQGAE